MFTHAVNASAVAGTSIWQSMFGFEIPATEKILRTLGVYLGLAIIMRLAGKRQLAQLNSFDLIVMLLLSNVVQNAVIGPDNSLTGGLLGAVRAGGFQRRDRADRDDVLTHHDDLRRHPHHPRQGRADPGEAGSSHRTARPGGRLGAASSGRQHPGGGAPGDAGAGGSISVELTREAETATYGELRQAVLDLQRHLDERLSVLERGDRGPLGGDGVPG